MASLNASVIRCDYINSYEYRKFVNRMANSGCALSSGLWWVERVDGSVGVAYHLFNRDTYCGRVMKEDLHGDTVEVALWNLMRFIEGHCDKKSSIYVFPHNWKGTTWENKSHEFLSVSGAGCKSLWMQTLKSI